MHFYGLYKLLPKLVQFWSAKWIQALSGTRYSVFSPPWCLLTSFFIPLCTLLFALASPSSQNKCVFNLSTLKTHIEPACLHSYILLLSLLSVSMLSAVYFCCLEFISDSVLGHLLQFHWHSSCQFLHWFLLKTDLGDSIPSLTYLTYWLQGTNSTSVSVLKFTSAFIHSHSNWKQTDVSLSPCQ